jgi:hypothetical protein
VNLAGLLPLVGLQSILLRLAAAEPHAGLSRNEDEKTPRLLK